MISVVRFALVGRAAKSRLPPVLREQAHRADLDVVRQRLAHVVDRERGGGGAHERFHLDAGLVMHGHVADDADACRRAASAMSTEQRSSASGWQNGMISCVRLAAMTPATMAVSNTGPFFVRWPVRASSRATAGGSLTVASALASREVAVLAPTSTMVGRLAASRWVEFSWQRGTN